MELRLPVDEYELDGWESLQNIYVYQSSHHIVHLNILQFAQLFLIK